MSHRKRVKRAKIGCTIPGIIILLIIGLSTYYLVKP